MSLEGGRHLRATLAELARHVIVLVLGPGQPDLADLERPEGRLAAQEPRDVVLVGVAHDDHRQPSTGLGRDVVEHGRQRADVAADMDPAVDEHVLVVGEAHEEAVAEPDPVHPDPDRGGAGPWPPAIATRPCARRRS